MVREKRISVALVTYNGESFLQEQLDSILYQLGEEDELVISDDGSTDGTLDIIRKYQEEQTNIRLVKGPGKGIKKNVEHVLKQCKGAYIFLADQDDIWMPDKVETVLRIFQEQQVSLVIHDAVVFTEDVNKPLMESFFAFRNSGPGVMKNMIKNSYIGCCMALKAEVMDKIFPIPEKIEMHDQWIGILNDRYFKKGYFYKKPLLYYRRHGENNSAMTHYGPWKMIRNRLFFFWYLTGRILHLY